MEKEITIVHIAPHLGGGVGTSLANFFYQSQKIGVKNKIFCLDWCENQTNDTEFGSSLIQGFFWKPRKDLEEEILKCDCVIIHYWNHPLLSVFLCDFVSIKNRSIFWCHNSGIAEPHIIPDYLVEIADTIVFTSESSLNTPNFSNLISANRNSPMIVPTERDIRAFLNKYVPRDYGTSVFNLLYVGSVSRAKMHPDAAFIFSQLSQRGFQIVVVGGPDHIELSDEVKSLGGNVRFFGHVENVIDFYTTSDIFIYPLRENHYGTGEQVILEALASGLPVVAFNNPAEASILRQFSDLDMANSTSNFIEIVLNMAASPEGLTKISRRIHRKASKLYGTSQMSYELLKIVDEVVESSKGISIYRDVLEITDNLIAIYARASFFDSLLFTQILQNPSQGVELILSKIESLQDRKSTIELWLTKTKSTPEHYLKYFPLSEQMGQLVEELRNRFSTTKNF